MTFSSTDCLANTSRKLETYLLTTITIGCHKSFDRIARLGPNKCVQPEAEHYNFKHVLDAFYFQTDFNLRSKRKQDVRLDCERV